MWTATTLETFAHARGVLSDTELVFCENGNSVDHCDPEIACKNHEIVNRNKMWPFETTIKIVAILILGLFGESALSHV